MHWYLKKPDDSIYGPVDHSSLQRWAEDGRISPTDQLSKDQKKWHEPSHVKDLHMSWTVELPDGSTYGPVNILALREPIKNEEVTIFCRLINKRTEEETTVGEALLGRLLLEDEKLRAELQEISELPAENSKPAREIASQLEEATKDTPPDATLKESLQRRDVLERELIKWKKLYEEERADTSRREEELNDRIRELRTSERASHDSIEQLKREITHMEKKYKVLRDTTDAQSCGDAPDARSQLTSLMDAYNDLTQNYDNILRQLTSQTEEAQSILDSRAQLEADANDRIERMEARLLREQEEADRARHRLAEMEDTHLQLLKSYREMNDRFIRLRDATHTDH